MEDGSGSRAHVIEVIPSEYRLRNWHVEYDEQQPRSDREVENNNARTSLVSLSYRIKGMIHLAMDVIMNQA
jgi:hypothetical protein